MKDVLKVMLIALLAVSAKPLWALDDFICQCKAKGPGYEATNKAGGVDKICSYSCDCLGWTTKTAVPGIKLDVLSAPTSAYSYESWDSGSHICHGQYSYKGNLSDENWKIKVMFDTFTINSKGEVSYPENARRQVSAGISEVDFKFSKQANEISSSLKDQLKKY